MNKLYKVLLLMSVLTLSAQSATKTIKYKIKSGDTLTSIAKKHKTSISSIAKANGIKSTQTLKLGKVLKVPTKVTTTKKRKKKRVVKRSRHSESQLASTLKSVKFKKANAKKSNKFSINDILFSSKNNTKQSKRMIEIAKGKLGRKYVWGATGKKNTFDCSGFTSYVCKKNGISIPRTSIRQSKYGKYVSRKNLRPGDLIFFDTSKKRRGYVNHVGIYIGNNKFIHASSARKKVIITSLNKNFYSQRFKGGRRVLH
ncbi:Invasion associated protein p60 [hydrothermal vent metagenome]|uniref:Invasion associated protein p60 n=1 Tax=hydrothermal vent metagenome TaxID=652676 RepID=A0A1W1EFN0_9ZZZZ